jgi:bifunctional non-homologous end joining protein LigD
MTVKVSRPGKELFPDGTTKADLAGYYEAVADVMLPHLADRPLNLERYPDGIGGERIMQQRAGRYFPDWIERVRTPKKGGTVEHVVASDADTLVYLAGQACITLHPWLSRTDRLDRPDRLIVDLDPSDGTPAGVRTAAQELGDLMRELELEPFAMTTGSRGYHVVAPLQRRHDFDEVRAFARDLAGLAADRDPELTVEQRKAKRGDRILVDVMRNAYAHTAVAPYAVRARPGAPVATPLHWDELADSNLRPDRWDIRTVRERLERDGDPWAEISRAARALGPARRRLAAMLAR